MRRAAARRLAVPHWSPFPFPEAISPNVNKAGSIGMRAKQFPIMCLPVEPALSAFRETAYKNSNGDQQGTVDSLMSFSKTLYPHCCSPPRCINDYPVGNLKN